MAVTIKTTVTVSLPAEVLVSGSKTRTAVEAAFIGGIAKATGLSEANIKMDSVTKARLRLQADDCCKVAYTITIPKGSSPAVVDKVNTDNTASKDPKAVAAVVYEFC